MKVLSKSKHVLIRPESTEKVVNGIIIPDTVGDRKQRWGVILSCGDYKDEDLTVGMKVYYRMAGVNIAEIEGENLHFVPYDSILGYE